MIYALRKTQFSEKNLAALVHALNASPQRSRCCFRYPLYSLTQFTDVTGVMVGGASFPALVERLRG